MNSAIVQSSEILTIVGGGPCDLDTLETARLHGKDVVAADGGASFCLQNGVAPKAVIGDMDSVNHDLLADLPPNAIHHIAEQDTTDFDKTLRNCAAPLLLGVGFLGGRIDHELSVLSTLAQRGFQKVALLGSEDIIFHCPPALDVDLPQGSRFSLFPLREVRATSSGLEWPLDGLILDPMGQIGTSNRVNGTVRVTCDKTGLIVIVPRLSISPVLDALQKVPAWPAPAK